MADHQPRSLLEIQKEQELEASKSSRFDSGGDTGGGSSGNYGGRGHHHQQHQHQHQHQHQQQQQRGFGGSRGGGGRGQQHRRMTDRSSLPLEGGVICSMKDSFGFIHCAERDEELFFHFSEVSCHPADLHVDDEVQFRVGVSGGNRNSNTSNNFDHDSAKKYAAFEVKRVPTGTVVWETEDEVGKRYKGIVERPIRTERGSNIQTVDGLIKVLPNDGTVNSDMDANEAKIEEEDGRNKNHGAPTGSVIRVRFTAGDVQQSGSKSNNAGRLYRGDIVEFNIVTEKRTKMKYARTIKLNRSERDRARAAKEQKLLEAASLEQGVITSLKTDYGFIRSNRRKEEVYFHFSHVQLEGKHSEQQQTKARDILREGQEMEFLVVTEDNIGPKPPRVSARNLQMLPQGTVQFSSVLANGVTGIVMRCPQPPDSAGRGEKWGSIQLSEPITVNEDSTTTGKGQPQQHVIKNVYLKSRNSPGGTFAIKGSPPGLWIRDGDTLLFDVVREIADNACFAEPTTSLQPILKTPTVLADTVGDVETEEGEEQEQNKQEKVIEQQSDLGKSEPAVRLIKLSLVGLAEGIIHTVKEAYGFIHFAERPVDVHFKMYEVLPERLQYDLRRNMGVLSSVGSNRKPLMVTPGTEVMFDMSVQGTVSSFSTRARNRNDRENLKAQRILFLSPGTIFMKKVLASKVQGVVIKEDPNQPYAGSIELDHEVEALSLEQRHPLVADMIQTFLSSKERNSIVFHDLQSLKEDSVVIDMITLKGKDSLTFSHIPVPGETVYPGRLCIRKDEKATAQGTSNEQSSDNITEDDLHTDDEVVNMDQNTSTSSDNNVSTKRKKKKKKNKQSKLVKIIRFDKGSLASNIKEDIPPSIGDIVCFDVVQIRRTGKVNIENLTIVTRKFVDHSNNAPTSDAGVGIVKELVPLRQFGFISVVAENSSKREVLFFHYSTVKSSDSANATNNNKDVPAEGPNKKINISLRKGDEVKFDVGVEKNGKRIALNVEAIPKGTVSVGSNNNNKEQKNICRGYILVEPSHTEIGGGPSRNANSGSRNRNQGAGVGRWDNVSVDDNPAKNGTSKGNGYILLLEDPMDVFATWAPSAISNLVPTAESEVATSSEVKAVGDGGEGENASITATSSETDNNNVPKEQPQQQQEQMVLKSAVGCHFPYKHGAIANQDATSHPRRGDLVSFQKVKGSSNGVRDIRIISRGSAKMIRGNLQGIELSARNNSNSNNWSSKEGKAKFVTPSSGGGRGAGKSSSGKEYDISLHEVVSCNPEVLKENELVEGVIHDGCIYGICRANDLYLGSKNSKFASSHKERPKLNLTVKKDRGGTIMAQSMMAKGPDGTNGFAKGWTGRVSHYERPSAGAVDVAVVEDVDVDAGNKTVSTTGLEMFLPAYYTHTTDNNYYEEQHYEEQQVVMDGGNYYTDGSEMDGEYYYVEE